QRAGPGGLDPHDPVGAGEGRGGGGPPPADGPGDPPRPAGAPLGGAGLRSGQERLRPGVRLERREHHPLLAAAPDRDADQGSGLDDGVHPLGGARENGPEVLPAGPPDPEHGPGGRTGPGEGVSPNQLSERRRGASEGAPFLLPPHHGEGGGAKRRRVGMSGASARSDDKHRGGSRLAHPTASRSPAPGGEGHTVWIQAFASPASKRRSTRSAGSSDSRRACNVRLSRAAPNWPACSARRCRKARSASRMTAAVEANSPASTIPRTCSISSRGMAMLTLPERLIGISPGRSADARSNASTANARVNDWLRRIGHTLW